MKIKTLVCFFLIIVGFTTHAIAHVIPQPHQHTSHRLPDPYRIVEQFNQAVERGELVIFDQTIRAEMITPLRVEYVYELRNSSQRIKVYSQLIEPLPVPGQNNCQIRGISAHVDKYGNIVDTEVHIWAE
jgi:hypothetical protein